MYNKTNYEIYAVEANPVFTGKLLQQKKKYEDSRISKSYTLYNGTGISTINGFGHLIMDCAGCDKGSAGSTLISDSLSAVGKKVPIRLLDIISLFRAAKVRSEDFVFVKMDIEGLEYDIVRRLLVTGLLNHLVDKIAVEWHHKAHFVFGAPRRPTDPNYEQRLAIHNKYLRRFESIQWIYEDSSELADKFIAWG